MEAQREGFLKDEYLFLQNSYESFDQRALTIKGWAVTLSLGGFAAGFQYKNVSLWVLGSVSALLFWLIEATWKSFQYTLAARITQIEKYFAADATADIRALQAYTSWFSEWRRISPIRRILGTATLFIVYVPYVPICVGGAILVIWHTLVKPFWGK